MTVTGLNRLSSSVSSLFSISGTVSSIVNGSVRHGLLIFLFFKAVMFPIMPSTTLSIMAYCPLLLVDTSTVN